MSHAFLNTFFCLPFVQWVESLPPVCPRTWLAPFPQTLALMSTPSSHWTIWKSTHWRLMACTCSMTRTWSLLTQPQRTRFASTGSNGSTRTGGVNAAALGGEQISGGHWFRQTDRQLDANRHNQRNIIAGKTHWLLPASLLFRTGRWSMTFELRYDSCPLLFANDTSIFDLI